jgi:hypothetical protein
VIDFLVIVLRQGSWRRRLFSARSLCVGISGKGGGASLPIDPFTGAPGLGGEIFEVGQRIDHGQDGMLALDVHLGLECVAGQQEGVHAAQTQGRDF